MSLGLKSSWLSDKSQKTLRRWASRDECYRDTWLGELGQWTLTGPATPTPLWGQLFHDSHATSVIACGGLLKYPPIEAEVMRDVLLSAGVPNAVIWLETRSTTTAENLTYVLPILDELGTRSIVLVTDWFHLPRAKLVAHRLGLSCAKASPGPQRTYIGQQALAALYEIPAYIADWLRLKGRPRPNS